MMCGVMLWYVLWKTRLLCVLLYYVLWEIRLLWLASRAAGELT